MLQNLGCLSVFFPPKKSHIPFPWPKLFAEIDFSVEIISLTPLKHYQNLKLQNF